MFNVDLGTLKKIKFLQISRIDKYNKEIGNEDPTYQLHGDYQVGQRLKNSK